MCGTKDMRPEYSYGVVSIPHESKGEQIVLVTNNEKVTSAMLHEYVKNNGMSELYLPRVILYHEKLPVFATGKADNVTLKKCAAMAFYGCDFIKSHYAVTSLIFL